MPTLVLPGAYSEDTIRVAQAATRAGWTVERLRDWLVPPGTSFPDAVLYGEPPFCEMIAPRLGLEVLAPPLDVLYHLPRHFLKREIVPTTLGDARKMKGKFQIRPTAGRVFPMGTFVDGRGLPGPKLLGDRTPVLMCEVREWEWQYRFFIGGGQIATYCPFRKGTETARDDEGRWLFDKRRDRAASDRARALIEEVGDRLPPSYAVDFGFQDEQWAVAEILCAAEAELFGCSEDDALKTVQTATRTKDPR